MAAQPVPMRTRSWPTIFMLIACLAISCSMASSTLAQKDKKKKKDANAAESHTTVPMGEEQQIDYKISEMLGAWQLGDVDRLHQTYADDAVFVSGLWAPPVFGWASYLPLYQQQRQRMQQVRMDRSNTFIKVSGTVGWACYQWDFGGTVDGQAAATRGQTTLVLEKRSDRWVIVHNHTSMTSGSTTPASVPAAPAGATPAATPQPQPGKPPTT